MWKYCNTIFTNPINYLILEQTLYIKGEQLLRVWNAWLRWASCRGRVWPCPGAPTPAHYFHRLVGGQPLARAYTLKTPEPLLLPDGLGGGRRKERIIRWRAVDRLKGLSHFLIRNFLFDAILTSSCNIVLGAEHTRDEERFGNGQVLNVPHYK